MESGTLLHIALLRKTSKANRRTRKSHNTLKYSIQEENSKIGLNPQDDDHFMLSAWNTCEEGPTNKIGSQKVSQIANIKKLRQSMCEGMPKSTRQRSYVKTSESSRRPRLRANSFRNYNQISAKNVQMRLEHPLKEIFSQKDIKTQKKVKKYELFLNPLRSERQFKSCKQNDSTCYYQNTTKANSYREPETFTKFINLSNIKNRRFFKN